MSLSTYFLEYGRHVARLRRRRRRRRVMTMGLRLAALRAARASLKIFSLELRRIEVNPCVRLARGKFELTHQDSAGGKKSRVLTSNKQGFEIRQLFLPEMTLNIHEKGSTF